jgi:hypothetical protein
VTLSVVRGASASRLTTALSLSIGGAWSMNSRALVAIATPEAAPLSALTV